MLSVIIPFFNEETIIENNIIEINNYLKPKYEFELIIVNDSGKSSKILENLVNRFNNFICIQNQHNYGKGESLRRGIKASKGDIVLITDADLATPISEIEKLHNSILKGNDFAIGSRNMKDSKINLKQPITRIIAGKSYNFLINIILGIKFADTQCGFKLFKGSKLRDIIKYTTSKRFGIDLEIIFYANKKNYKIAEIGVNWFDKKNSSVKLITDSILMFYELIKLRMKG